MYNIFIYVLKLKKGYCPVCNEPLEEGNIGYLEVNQDNTGFYLVPVCKRCIFHLYQTNKQFKRRRLENEKNKSISAEKMRKN